jgi:hypothetical protein
MQAGEGSASAAEVKEEKKEDKDKVHVKILCSMFFDGTLNSRDNVLTKDAALKKKMVDDGNVSYSNSLSNVAKMEQHVKDKASGFDHSFSIYTEGPGTEALQVVEAGDSARTKKKKQKNAGHRKDAPLGFAGGLGDTGVKAKVTTGMSKLTALIGKDVPEKVVIDKLVIDVFGFSRGAAGARFFVHEVLNEESSSVTHQGHKFEILALPLFSRLKRNLYDISADKVEIRFVGLYDTVASCGLRDKTWDLGTSILKLDYIKHPAVKSVVQLASADEHRHNFSGTTIASALGKGKQVFLPGVHSDIGGGYPEHEPEDFIINSSDDTEVLEQDRQALIAQGWFKPHQLTLEQPGSIADFFGFDRKLRARRTTISNKYSTIPLNIMADFAKEKGQSLKGSFKSKCKVATEVSDYYGPIKDYANKGSSKAGDWFAQTTPAWLPRLRHKHFHFSAHYTAVAGIILPSKPRFDKNNKRIRQEYPG